MLSSHTLFCSVVSLFALFALIWQHNLENTFCQLCAFFSLFSVSCHLFFLKISLMTNTTQKAEYAFALYEHAMFTFFFAYNLSLLSFEQYVRISEFTTSMFFGYVGWFCFSATQWIPTDTISFNSCKPLSHNDNINNKCNEMYALRNAAQQPFSHLQIK